MNALIQPIEGNVSPPPNPPAAPGHVLVGVLPEMRRDKLGFLVKTSREVGEVVRLPLPVPMFMVTDPSAARRVLQDNHLNYVKGYGYQRLEPLLGKGLLTAEGEDWKRKRRLAQPAFHRQRIAGFADLMVRHTERMLASWAERADASFDVHQELMQLTLGVVGEALFSVDLSEKARDVGEALTKALEIFNRRFDAVFIPPSWLPTPENVELKRALSVLDEVVFDIIQERRKTQAVHHDLLGMLMEGRFEDEAGNVSGLTDVQLRDEVMTMVLAGHETTANALSWALILLSTHPEVDRRLFDSLAPLGGRTPGMGDLPALGYTKQVVEEAMRLYPPAWAVGRRALADDELGGYRIPAGSNVMVVTYIIHRNRRFFENPEGFDPDRFSPEAGASNREAFFPFVSGPRICIGAAFAMMEMQLVLAMIAARYRVELVPGQRIVPEPRVTLRPKEGALVTVRPRQK